VPLGFFGLLILLVVAVTNRGETDPGGRRPYAAYLFLVCFVGVFVLLFSTFALANAGVRVITGTDAHNGSHVEFGVGGVSQRQTFTACGRSIPVPGSSGSLGGSDSSSGSGSLSNEITPCPSPGNVEHPTLVRERGRHDAAARTAAQAGLAALVAALLLAFHFRRVPQLVEEPGFAGSGAERMYRTYLYAVCFVAVLIVVGAAVSAVYGVFRALGPGVFAPSALHARKSGVAELLSGAILAGLAAIVFATHWQRAAPFRPVAPRAGPAPEAEPIA
jgi:hypothetical protein